MCLCVSAAWLTGVCVCLCVSAAWLTGRWRAHVTRLHALCGNKLPHSMFHPDAHTGSEPEEVDLCLGRRVEAGASACVRGRHSLHHRMCGSPTMPSPSWLVEGLTGSPRRGPVSLLPSGGCLRFRFLSHCGWQGLCGCWGLTIRRSPGVAPLCEPCRPSPPAVGSCVFPPLPSVILSSGPLGPATSRLAPSAARAWAIQSVVLGLLWQ